MINAFITLALIVWLLQILFSWLQIRRFNRAFLSMKKGHYIGIGRNHGKRFTPRVLIALSVDADKIVIDSLLMKGITVFALPKPIPALHGLALSDIIPAQIFPDNPACQRALVSALTSKYHP
ncbi:transcriptional regulator GutM [Orbaceae bacterium ESL0727]|nr:transcriptional regulator GutM [Orbaceae bacterium ESL0727]